MAKLTRKDKIRLQAMAAQNATTASLSNEDMMLLLKAKDLENERLKAELAQEKKKNASSAKSPLKIIRNQRKIISIQSQQIKTLEGEKEFLFKSNENRKSILAECYEGFRLLQLAKEELFRDENIPNVDTWSFESQKAFFKRLVAEANTAFCYKYQFLEQCITHQKSEKNPRNVNLNLSQNEYGQQVEDEQSQAIKAYGDEQAKAETIATAEIPDDDVEDDVVDAVDAADVSDKAEDVLATLQSQISANNQQKSIDDIMGATADVITDILSDQKGNAQGNGNTVANRDAFIKPEYTVAKANNVISINKDGGYIEAYCPICDKVHKLKIVNKVPRVNEIITSDNGRMGKTLITINMAICEKTGKEFEINPVTYTEFDKVNNILQGDDTELLNQLNEELSQSESEEACEEDKQRVKAILDFQKSLSEEKSKVPSGDISARHDDKRGDTRAQRKQDVREIMKSPLAVVHKTKYSSHLLKNEEGIEAISPSYVIFNDGAELPPFLKVALGSGTLIDAICEFSFLSVPKSRICKFLQGCGFDLGKSELIALINAFARAYLNPITKQIRKDMLSKCKTILMDETTLKVRELIEAYNKKTCYVWGMTTGFTEKFKAAWFKVSHTRSYTNILDIIGGVDDVNLNTITADGYSGYDRGLAELEKLKKIVIELSRCFTHCRRNYHEFLEGSGLLKVYREQLLPANASFADFYKNLAAYKQAETDKINNGKGNKESALKLLETKCGMLTIYYLINTLYVIDSKEIKGFNYDCSSEEFIESIEKARKLYSSKIVDAIFDCAKLLVINDPSLLKVRINKKTGKMYFNKNNLRNESKALLYTLKFEEQLRLFVNDPTVELSQSAAERIMRTVVCSKQNGFEFIDSADGANSFTDMMSVINTCMLNRVPVREYLLWLVANIRLRLNKMVASGYKDKTLFKMPGRRKVEGDGPDDSFMMDMYDKQNHIAYDDLDVRGLTPYDYKEFIIREQMQSKIQF